MIPNRGIVALPATSAARAFRQCSRATPREIDGVSVATVADTTGLTKMLAARLERALDSAYTPGSPRDAADRGKLRTYYAQLSGFTTNRRRFIYLNGFISSTLKDIRDSTWWRHEPIVVCDGGEAFFGAVIDVGNLTVLDFHFNDRG